MDIFKKSKMQYMVLFVTLGLFFSVTYMLNQPQEGEVPTALSKIQFEKAYVSEVLIDEASSDVWTEGLRIGSQQVVVTLTSGENKGIELPAYNFMSAYSNVDLDVGTKIIVRLDHNEAGNLYVSHINGYDRSFLHVALVGLFIVLMIAFGGKKGISALLGLGFTIFSIWYFLIPLIKRGYPVIPAAIMLISITTFTSLVFLNGFSKKTVCATVGCVGGVAIAGCVAHLAGVISPINGFNMPEAEEIILRAGTDIKISGLLVSGILISALGAVMDVALMIASAVSEIHSMNPKVSRMSLFQSGINIGQDAMGTMANTLILAFAGASLNMLLLFRIFDYPIIQIMNSDLMTIEIIQSVAGSIGIVLTVPLVAAISATMYARPQESK